MATLTPAGSNRPGLSQQHSDRTVQQIRSRLSLRHTSTRRIPRLRASPAAVGNGADTEPAAEPLEEDDDDSIPGLTIQQVQTMLQVLCQETELAELELKMGSFELKVRRSAAMSGGNGKTGGAQAPQYAMHMGSPFASTQSMDAPEAPAPSPQQSIEESSDDEDESTIAVEATKVGIMRRSRYVKGKKVGKGPLVEAGTKVRAGQPICFIEQLGTFVPVEVKQAGEIASFLVDEGQSVEYKQPLADMYPYFGGHIIGDKKHA